jgi:23S rRNA G2445 N2-methylase RlmL
VVRIFLELRVRDPGFTPGVGDVDGLVEMLADDGLAKYAEASIARAGPATLDVLRARFRKAGPPLRARILRTIGRLGGPDAHELLIAALDDSDAKTRRNAAIALGRGRGHGAEEALLRSWDRDARTEMRRSIAVSLGKVGSTRSLALLREASRHADAQLAQAAERAILMIERTESRASRGRLDCERVADEPIDIEALARRGLEDLLSEELKGIAGLTNVRVIGAGRVRARLTAAPGALFSARTMLSFRFPLATESRRDEERRGQAVARAVTSREATRVLSTWTVGAVRYRIAWKEGGHRRADTWDTARTIARRAPALVNDPTASLWELVVADNHSHIDVALVPRALDDPRFSWRRRDVPAASHPTIAAALARVAGVRPDDVVWDPFVGSAAELIERGLAGPYRTLRGSDIDPKALRAARTNLDAAGVAARLERADAYTHAPRGVTLLITNPPMGRRASRSVHLAAMLDRFVRHAASLLAAGGRMVWIAPWPARARAAATRAGLRLDWAHVVDMGGFDAEMQRWIKP